MLKSALNDPSHVFTIWVLKAFHFSYFMGLGISLPVLTVWYKKDLHFNGYEIALLTAVAPLSSVISQNLLGLLVDFLQRFKAILAILLGGASLSLLLLYFFHSFFSAFWLISLFALFSLPVISIMNSSLMHYYGTETFHHFGNIRSWGTLGFLFANFFLSQLLPESDIKIFLLLHSVSLFICFLLIPLLPEIKVSVESSSLRNIAKTLNNPLLAKLAIALIFQQIAFSAIDNYVSIYFTELGASPRFSAQAWGAGVVLEYFVIRYSGKFIERYSIKAFILLGIAATLLRLMLYSFSLPLWAILIVQISHSVAFSGSYLGAVFYIGRIINARARTSSQASFDSIVRRGGVIIGSLIGGAIFENFGVQNLFSVMSLFSLTAFILVYTLIPARPNQANS